MSQQPPLPPAPQFGQPEPQQPQPADAQPGQAQYGQPQFGQAQFGQAQYGQAQYGQPSFGEQAPYVPAQPQAPYGQSPAFPGPTAARPGSGMAITSLVLGILALLICLIPIVGVFAVLLALVGAILGGIALVKARKGAAGGKGMAIAGLVLSVLAFVGGVGSSIVYLVLANEATQDLEQFAEDLESSANDAGTSVDPGEVEAAEADALPLGTTATVGEWDVAVTNVTLNANDMVAAANDFNEPPTNQYVVVDISATYNGSEEADAWFALSAVIQGSDARQYSDTDCGAVLPNDAINVPTLTAGGSADFQFCMDVPPAALEGATLFVEETMSFDDTRVYWNVQ